jgi:transposase
MTYYTGIDVSLRSVSICVVDDSGAIRFESKVVAETEAIVGALRKFEPEIRQVGFEAGTLTQYLTYGLRAAGFEVICMEARQVAASLAAMRNKTDRNDARGLAQILRTGWYRAVHVKSAQSHQVRALLSSRKAILSKCIDLENELRGLLKVIGVPRCRLSPSEYTLASFVGFCERVVTPPAHRGLSTLVVCRKNPLRGHPRWEKPYPPMSSRYRG